jgi:hypothetical protein
MIALAGDERAWGHAWHVPTAAPMTVREFIVRTAKVGKLPEPRISQYPGLVVRGAALFDKFAREFGEMSYQFKRPFVLDSSRVTETFGLRHTDVDEALRVSLAG